MKKIYTYFTLITLFLFNTSGFSQQLNVFWGKENPVDRFASTHILCKYGDGLFGYKTTRNKVSIIKYNLSDLLIKSEYPIIGSKSSKNSNVIDNDYSLNSFIVLKNKLYVTVSKYDRKADLNSVYAQEISTNGSLTGTFTKLASISSKTRRNSGTFEFIISEDSTKFLLVNNPPFEKYAGEKFGYKIFDNNLKELNNLEITLPYKDNNFSAENYILSKEGIIHLLAKVYIEKQDKKKGEATFYYEVLSIDPAGKGKIIEYEIKLPNKYISEVSYVLDDKNGIICSGFYGNIEKKGISYNDINGIFYIRINKATKQIESKGIKELDKDFVSNFTSKRKADKGRGISSTFRLREFVKKPDGGAMLIAESAYDYTVTTTSVSSSGVTTTRTTYHYVRDNIIAININPDGSIKWYTNIPKDQHTVNDGGAYSSFMFAQNKDKYYFIYNDNPRNLDPTKVKSIKDIRTMSSPKTSTAVIVELSEKGEYTKKELFSNKEAKSVLMPQRAYKLSPKEHVVTSMNGGFYCCMIPLKAAKSKLVRLSFK